MEQCSCPHCNNGPHYLLRSTAVLEPVAYAPTADELRNKLPADTKIEDHVCTATCTEQYRGDKLKYAITKIGNLATMTSMFGSDADLLAELWISLKDKKQ